MSVRMALPLRLIFLLMSHRISFADWVVNYSPSPICALKDSSVIISCNYTYPAGFQIITVYWIKGPIIKGGVPPDLSEDPEYSQRLQYLGDKQQNCTVRLSNVTKKDEHQYYFRYISNEQGGKWIGRPGVTLNVTDLQVESPERAKEGDSVRLTCKSSCNLTDTPTFIWYRNSQPLTEKSNELLLQSITKEDGGRYRCAVHGHTLTSPEVLLNVTYPPKKVSVSIIDSDSESVSLSCSSDSNPPALNFSWFKENQSSAIGSGQSFRAVQIGLFYCEAHNPYGYLRSDPINVTLKVGHLVIFYISAGGVCTTVVFITAVGIWGIWRTRKRNDQQQSRVKHSRRKACVDQLDQPVYGNVTDGSDHCKPDLNSTLYETVMDVSNHCKPDLNSSVYETITDGTDYCKPELNSSVYENLPVVKKNKRSA